MANLSMALSAWGRTLSFGCVLTNSEVLEPWRASTFDWRARPLAVLRPGSAEEAVACLRIASEYGCPLYPVSRGRSWGLGSRLPVEDAVILDLSRLDRILDLDLEHGTVRVEPGVTFRMLTDALLAAGSRYHVPAFGGPPDASVLANALDRGEGSGSRGDRYACLFDLDVALTSGERLRTGFGRYEAADLARVHGRPAGPLIDGLFSQSGFGCVLSGRMELAPTPRYGRYMLVEIGEAERMDPMLAATAELLRRGIVDTHDLYLWDGAKRIASQLVRAEAEHADLGGIQMSEWAATLAITAHEPEIFEAKLAAARRLLAPLGEVLEDDNDGGELDGALRGVSSGANLNICYWEKPGLPDIGPDPDRDRCGFLWICPVMPLEGGKVRELVRIVRAASARSGIFAACGLEAASQRTLQGYVSLSWDRDSEGADASARAAHDEIMTGFVRERLLPYRLAHPTIGTYGQAAGDWSPVIERLRAALDPAGVLAPGRVAASGRLLR